MTALDNRVPVTLIHVDEYGTATVEFFNGERMLYGVGKLEAAECYRCGELAGEMEINTYGSIGRLRPLHVSGSPCAIRGAAEDERRWAELKQIAGTPKSWWQRWTSWAQSGKANG